MNIPVHIAGGGIFAVLLYTYFGLINSAAFFCFASFTDADHYLYYVVKFRDINLRKAVFYFESHKWIERFCLCIFHTVEFFMIFGAAAYLSGSPFIKACFWGYALHYLTDILQGLYYRRVHYRWWSIIHYYSKNYIA